MLKLKFSTHTILLGLTLGLSTLSYAAEKKAPQKTINVFNEMVKQCVEPAVTAKLGTRANVTKVCTCTTKIKATKLTLGEFWDIQGAAINGQDPLKIPALQRILPELNKCSEGVPLNRPAK